MLKALTAALVIAATTAAAAPNCASREQARGILVDMFGEEVVVRGLNQNGDLIQIWGNPESGSWTATATRGDLTCIIAQGEAFERVALKPNT